MLSLHGQRGQTFPVWAMGSLSVLVLLACVVNYGNMLVWQFRAQNAADAAARGMLSSQTSQWNQTIALLHAAAVDEYRIRYILRDLDEVANNEGGCIPHPSTSNDPTSCPGMYHRLRAQFMDAVAHYTTDAELLNDVASPGQATQVADMQAALSQLQKPGSCGTAGGADCGFTYTLVGTQSRTSLEDVYADCCTMVVGGGTVGDPKPDLTPLSTEVVACAHVPSLIPQFLNFHPPQFYAIGRAAATSIMADQEFMYLGSVVNPTTNQVFQPAEYPESDDAQPQNESTNDRYYRIDYGGNPNNPWNSGNPASSNGIASFTYDPANAGLLAATGWWSAMPIATFMNQLQIGVQFQCS